MFQGPPILQYAPVYAPNPYQAQASQKVPAGICGILLGGIGVHKFILGYPLEGCIMLAISVIGGILTCGVVSMIMHIIGLVEGIVYLSKTDADFVNTYVVQRRGWF